MDIVLIRSTHSKILLNWVFTKYIHGDIRDNISCSSQPLLYVTCSVLKTIMLL